MVSDLPKCFNLESCSCFITSIRCRRNLRNEVLSFMLLFKVDIFEFLFELVHSAAVCYMQRRSQVLNVNLILETR